MARKVEFRLIDDLDGSRADETVTFGLDGSTFEIDLSAKHAKELRASLDRYLLNARRVRHTRTPAAGHRGQPVAGGAARTRPDGLQSQAIRQWAQRKGLGVSTRGRIPQSVIDRYQAEAGRAQPAAETKTPAASTRSTTKAAAGPAKKSTARAAAGRSGSRATTTTRGARSGTRRGKA